MEFFRHAQVCGQHAARKPFAFVGLDVGFPKDTGSFAGLADHRFPQRGDLLGL